MTNSRAFPIAVSAAILLCWSSACEDARRPANAPVSADLIVLQGAYEVHSQSNGNFERLWYRVNASYPPARITDAIAARLASRGWRPLRNNFFNREEISDYVRGWVEYASADTADGPRRFTCRWWSQWVNDRGEVLDYALIYVSPTDQLTNRSTLDVSVTKSPIKALEQISRIPTDGSQKLYELPLGAKPNSMIASDNSPEGAYVVHPHGAV